MKKPKGVFFRIPKNLKNLLLKAVSVTLDANCLNLDFAQRTHKIYWIKVYIANKYCLPIFRNVGQMKKRWAGINCMLRIEEILRRQAFAFSQPTSAEEVLSKWKPRRKKIDGRRAEEEEVMNQWT